MSDNAKLILSFMQEHKIDVDATYPQTVYSVLRSVPSLRGIQSPAGNPSIRHFSRSKIGFSFLFILVALRGCPNYFPFSVIPLSSAP